MKKHLNKALVASVTIFLLLGIWTISFVPRGDINSLVKGFVKVSYKKPAVSYTFVKKKPKKWRVLKKIPKNAVNAIMISEDWAFYDHSGIDVNQLKKAIFSRNGKKLRGASTISQQLVKNLFLSPKRSYIRKYKELVITLYLEFTLSKKKILETYLNIIEYGEGVYGLEAASRKYFSHSAYSLNTLEAAFLAMLLPNPKKYAQSFQDKKLTKYARATMYEILDKMRRAKMISKSQMNKLKKKRLSFEKRPRKKSSTSLSRKYKSGPRKNNTDDGSSYERRYKNDMNLEIDDGPQFDPDAMLDDESGLDEEFNVD